MTDERQPDDHADDTDARFGAAGRLAWCDERGIDVQFLNPTFLVGPIVQVARLGRFDLIHEVQSTWNRWAMDVVDGHADRLIPVTQIDLHDIDWSLGEMERMREAGSRAFTIPEAPVRGRGSAADGSRAVGRSISHPDFDPIWSAAEDLGMAAFAHVGFGRERINAGWANNGADDLLTFNALNMLVGSQIAPQLLVGSFVLDGVLERHPRLVVVVEEVGIDWLPHLVTTLEVMVGRTPEVLHDGEYRPGNLERGGYRLPLTPTEYLHRQVRVSPLAGIAADRRSSRTGAGPARVLQRLSARGGHGRRGGDLRTPTQEHGCSGAQLVLRGRRRPHRRLAPAVTATPSGSAAGVTPRGRP